MKVSELARELDITSTDVLEVLKSFKLKAKDADQDLSSAVISVIKSELTKRSKAAGKTKPVLKAKKTPETAESGKPESAAAQQAAKAVTKKTVAKTEDQVKTAVKKKVAGVKGDRTAPKAKKIVSTPVKAKGAEAAAQKTKPIKKASEKETGKSFPKISSAPVITLKPLARKRKKSMKGDTGAAVAVEKTADVRAQGLSPVEAAEAAKQPGAPLPETAQEIVRDESLQDIEVQVPITVKDLSVKLQQKPSIVLMHLMKMGVLCHINQGLEGDIVGRIVRDFGFNLTKIRTQEEQLIETHKEEEEDPALLKPRAPVVTFMGHVDHGKTTLLDRIRKSRVADSEHGGITQHMGAYSVTLPKGRITFLDTPGHEAFTSMRARGAYITDLVVLVVAADEGVMQQTEEAIDHARAAGVPILVALNKIDRRNADIDRVKKELSERDLMPEDWGGKTVVAPVSAVTGEGVDSLLEMILLEAELLELKTNYEKSASGIVVEAHLSGGKGAVTTLIVQSGTLREGDILVVGPHLGKVKAMFDDHKREIGR